MSKITPQGLRLGALTLFEWMTGMRGWTADGRSFTFIWDPPGDMNLAHVAFDGIGPTMGCVDLATCIPNPESPATQGCLLKLVRQAYADDTVTTGVSRVDGWYVSCERRPTICTGQRTEAEALVAALEAMSGRLADVSPEAFEKAIVETIPHHDSGIDNEVAMGKHGTRVILRLWSREDTPATAHREARAIVMARPSGEQLTARLLLIDNTFPAPSIRLHPINYPRDMQGAIERAVAFIRGENS